MKLQNKVAIVTGGAMGNGLGITKVFLNEGAKVIILDYSSKLKETIEQIKNENLIGYNVDIRDYSKVKEAIADAKNKFGKVDILVNNAGICQLEPFMEMSDEKRDAHFDINIKGTWNVTKATLPHMEKGSIINLSSVTGPLVADTGEVAYATTKLSCLSCLR